MESTLSLSNGARHEDEIRLHEFWRLLIRNWPVIAFCTVLCGGAAAAYTFRTVPVYQSLTSIQIAEERTDFEVLDILQTLSTGSQVATEMEVLRSRTLAEDVADSLRLQVGVAAPRGVARVVLLRSIHVERWAPPGVYVLDVKPDGTFSITEGRDAEFGWYRGDWHRDSCARRDIHAEGISG